MTKIQVFSHDMNIYIFNRISENEFMETENHLTFTAQPRSCASLYETNKNSNLKKSETEENRSLMLSILYGLENLVVKLNKLEYLATQKNIEQILYNKSKEEIK
jgi:hypothetical protein